MGNTDNLDSWEQIRRGVVRVEALISQKQFNASMVEALQVLNLMLKGLAEKACIVETDPMLIIDELYQDRWISKSTCEHYHKIRIIGTKALNEGSNNAYDASQAHQLLSQEVYTFANEFYKVKKRRPFLRSGSRTAARNTQAAKNAIAARASAAQQAALAQKKQESRQAAPESQPISPQFRQENYEETGNSGGQEFSAGQKGYGQQEFSSIQEFSDRQEFPADQAFSTRQEFSADQAFSTRQGFPDGTEPSRWQAAVRGGWEEAAAAEETPSSEPEASEEYSDFSQPDDNPTAADADGEHPDLPEDSGAGAAPSPRSPEKKIPFAVKGIFRGRISKPAAQKADSIQETQPEPAADSYEQPENYQDETVQTEIPGPFFQDETSGNDGDDFFSDEPDHGDENFFSGEPAEDGEELFPDEPAEDDEELFPDEAAEDDEELFPDEPAEDDEELFPDEPAGDDEDFFSDDDDFFSDDDDFFSDEEEEEDFCDGEEDGNNSGDTKEDESQKPAADSKNIGAHQPTGSYSAPVRRSASAKRRKSMQAEDLLKILVPVAVIILLLIVISRLRPDRNGGTEPTETVQTTESVSETAAPDEEQETSPAEDENSGTDEETSAPETSEEEVTTAGETTAPESSSAPETEAPTETAAPETTAPPETTVPETQAPPETTAPETEAPTETAAPETTAPAAEAPAVTYVTTTELYVRSEPSGSSRSLGVLGAHVPVDFVRAYDDTWAVIMYEGQEAYVSFRYLTPQ